MSLERIIEQKAFIKCLYDTIELYFLYGARSNKKTNNFHSFIKSQLENIFKSANGYKIELEYLIDYVDDTKKKCDIVVLKDNIPFIIFPVKIIMTNYKQNKNNYFEQLTGELFLIKLKNPNVKLIPINIYFDKTPYLKKNSTIDKFEIVTFSDIKRTSVLKEEGLIFDEISYIIKVVHSCNISEKYTIPTIIGLDTNTPYKLFSGIV